MTELVPVRRGKSTQLSLADIQTKLDARKQVEETRTTTSTRKARVEEAKRVHQDDPQATLVEIQELSRMLASIFDPEITPASAPLTRVQINKISDEFLQFDRLRIRIEALEERYRELVYAHLNEVGPKIPGRPASQVPGKVEADGPGPHYVFERRGGNREDALLDADGMREVLPPDVVAQIYATVQHPAVEAWEEEVFNEAAFAKLVEKGVIDLDTVAPFLTPGKWRKPSFYKTLVDGDV